MASLARESTRGDASALGECGRGASQADLVFLSEILRRGLRGEADKGFFLSWNAGRGLPHPPGSLGTLWNGE
ncbi:hypothetical protein VULLAG_LOCUS9055 [Vulpes lagopus]